MATREESTCEGGLSARCISLLEEVKEVIEGWSNTATNTTMNGDETLARSHVRVVIASHVLLEQMRSQVRENKQSESYPCVLSDSLEVRGKGKANHRVNKTAKNRKRKERRKIKDKKHFCNAIESRKQHVKNLSNEQLTDEQITLLSRGLKFIPTPVTKENLIRRKLLADFDQFARRMRLDPTTVYFSRRRKRTSSFPR